MALAPMPPRGQSPSAPSVPAPLPPRAASPATPPPAPASPLTHGGAPSAFAGPAAMRVDPQARHRVQPSAQGVGDMLFGPGTSPSPAPGSSLSPTDAAAYAAAGQALNLTAQTILGIIQSNNAADIARLHDQTALAIAQLQNQGGASAGGAQAAQLAALEGLQAQLAAQGANAGNAATMSTGRVVAYAAGAVVLAGAVGTGIYFLVKHLQAPHATANPHATVRRLPAPRPKTAARPRDVHGHFLPAAVGY
jgi:hypothetical protein